VLLGLDRQADPLRNRMTLDLRPMESFDPAQPALVHSRRRMLRWQPEWADRYCLYARKSEPGSIEFDGLLLDGWKPASNDERAAGVETASQPAAFLPSSSCNRDNPLQAGPTVAALEAPSPKTKAAKRGGLEG
jgi:hypothetical protein